MKCPKCNYTTFDYYDFCPKCNKDLTNDKKFLNIITFELSDKNNYLVEPKIIQPIIKEEDEEPKSADLSTKSSETSEPENNMIKPEEKPESSVKAEKETEELSLENLLEDNKENDQTTQSTDISNTASDKAKIEHTQVSSDEEYLSLEDIDLGDILETNREE